MQNGKQIDIRVKSREIQHFGWLVESHKNDENDENGWLN